jgi:hypothetical protein
MLVLLSGLWGMRLSSVLSGCQGPQPADLRVHVAEHVCSFRMNVALVVDQALIQRDKNHASIIIWSMGNEAFFGTCQRSMVEYARGMSVLT